MRDEPRACRLAEWWVIALSIVQNPSRHGSYTILCIGAVFAWGWNRYGQVARDEAREVVAVPSLVAFPEGAGQIKTVAAGGMHSLALAADGRVWSWGHNASGQLGIGSEQEVHASPTQVSLPQGTAAAAIAAGWAHSALLTADGGELYTFGWGLYHQLGHGSTRDQSKPCVVDALRGLDPSCGGSLVQVACGSWHTAGFLADVPLCYSSCLAIRG